MACSLELERCPDRVCDDCEYYEEDEEETREVKATCDHCNKPLYEGDEYWGNNQIGTYCKDCADEEIAFWWGYL